VPEVPALRVEVAEEREPMIVNTGIAEQDDPTAPLPRDHSLQPGHDYLFWVEVGEPLLASIEAVPSKLDLRGIPAGSRLDIVLFAYANELGLLPDAVVGTLELQKSGLLVVAKQPVRLGHVPDGLLHRRLFFPFRTPKNLGQARLRCSIYWRGLLIQSRIVSVLVTPDGRDVEGANRAWIDDEDYALTRSAEPEVLSHVEPHVVSILFNDDPDSTHLFGFWHGENGTPEAHGVHIEPDTLKGVIREARGALRSASWGHRDSWRPKDPTYSYKYGGPANRDTLTADLISLARAGYRVYDGTINKLAGGEGNVPHLREDMRAPGFIQIASKRGPADVVPAAMIYDAELDTGDDLTVCQDFLNALDDPKPLWEQRCFQGDCQKAGLNVVCPSGFWGFRHNIGLPPSAGEPDSGTPGATGSVLAGDYYRIVFDKLPIVAFGVSTDPKFRSRLVVHEKTLQSLYPGMRWLPPIDNRDEFLSKLGSINPHLVYLFCHGGLDDGLPWIQIGALADPKITPDNLRARVKWTATRPLVFINGCETTELDPEIAMQFVSGFVENAGAVGVIGTEITVFESLACDFAEECLRSFLIGEPPDGLHRFTIGEAVRHARLKLLKAGNPLGLVYIPFAVASLRLDYVPSPN
jgi:hypothetical protein